MIPGTAAPLGAPGPASGGGSTGTVTGTQTNSAGGGAIAGGTVQLLQSGSVLSTATPNGSGVYTFSAVTAGNYTVTNQPPIGYSIADAGTFNISVSGGVTTTQDLSVQSAVWFEDFSRFSTTAQIAGSSPSGPIGYNYGQIPSSYLGGDTLGVAMGLSIQPETNGNATLNTTGGPTGGPCAQVDYPQNLWDGNPAHLASYCNANHTYGVEPYCKFPNNSITFPSEIWAMVDWKLDAAFQPGSSDCVAGFGTALKFFQLDFGPTNARLGVYIGGYANSGYSGLHWTIDMTDRIGGDYGNGGNISWTQEWRNAWHRCVIGCTNMQTSAAVYTMWMDGVQISQTTSPMWAAGATIGAQNQNLGLTIGGLMNNGPNAAESRYVAGIGLYYTRPSMIIT